MPHSLPSPSRRARHRSSPRPYLGILIRKPNRQSLTKLTTSEAGSEPQQTPIYLSLSKSNRFSLAAKREILRKKVTSSSDPNLRVPWPKKAWRTQASNTTPQTSPQSISRERTATVSTRTSTLHRTSTCLLTTYSCRAAKEMELPHKSVRS